MQEEVLYFLKKNNSYISGEEISQHLKISRAAIWKNIQELRKNGYDIVAVPHLGYHLVASPDKLFPWEIKFHLGTKVFGQKVFYHETLSSTMDEAFRLGVEGAPEGTVVCADGQIKGRGRLGRGWVSPKGKGLYMSIVLRPKLSPNEVAKLTLLCAVAVCEAVKSVSGISAMIKWPNDLLVENKKLAGILTELSAEVDRVKFVIVGIGINVNSTAQQLPAHATSFKDITGRSFPRIELIQEILRNFEKWYERFKAHGFFPIVVRWKELALTLGTRVRIGDPSGFVEGVAFDIDMDGGLLLRNDAGTIVKRMAGDVVVIR